MSLLHSNEAQFLAVRRTTRLFLGLGALVSALLVGTMVVRQGVFRPMVALGFSADTAQDIHVGQAVKIAGFRVGSVREVVLRPDGRVDIGLGVEAEQMRLVTRDAVVELRQEGLVGSAVLEIQPGPDRSQLATEEAVLRFRRADGLGKMVMELRDKVLPILDDVKTLTATLADSRVGLPATLGQVRETTQVLQAALRTGERQVEQIGGATTQVLGRAGRGLAEAQQDLARVGQVLDTVNQRLPALLDRTQAVLAHVEDIGGHARVALPDALRDGAAAAADARDIVHGVKSAWPVRAWVDTPQPQRLPADSEPRIEDVADAPR